MKSILLLLSGALLAGGVASGVTVFLLKDSGPARARQAAVLREPVSPTQTSGDFEALRGELAMLSRTVGELQFEITNLKSSAGRQPLAVANDAVTPESLAAAGLTPVQIEERMRDVFAAEREREALEEKSVREDRERSSAERQAERIGKELGLAAADTTRLADHLFVAGQKRRELFEGMRDGGFDRDTMRASMEELRTWNTDELYRNFSPSVAAQLEGVAGEMMGGGRGGPGGGFGGGGQRRGGNDNGNANSNPPGGG